MSAPAETNAALAVKATSYRTLAATVISLILVTVALYLTPDNLEHWHYILRRLFYFPIILSGVAFGLKGGGIVSILSSIVYLLRHDNLDRLDAIDHALDTTMFCLIGFLTGFLSQRERLQRETLRKTALRLEEVYRALQDNVEHLKRAARMSALGQLSAALAHEIRNPLASIEGAAYVAQSEHDAVRTSEFLQIIRKETGRLNNLVTHFLEFARPRSPELTAVDPRLLIDSVSMLVARMATETGVQIVNEISPAAPSMQCDSEQMKQVLLNLILNAIQAMPEGGQLKLSAEAFDKFLMLRVADTGPGISAQNADQIFDPFFSTKQNGTGLGLPIAYQIVQQHGGELILESNSSRGCCFALRMPVTAAVAEERPVA